MMILIKHTHFQVRHPYCVVKNYKYKQYTVKHNYILIIFIILYTRTCTHMHKTAMPEVVKM